MKSVKNQYIALKEGKMTEAQFMRNVRMTLPQYISNVTLFKQAERILINKGIIQEGIHDRDILYSPYTNVKSLEQSPEQLSKAADDRSENILRAKYSKRIQDPNISDDELRYLLSGKGVKGFGGTPNAINKIIADRNSNKIAESEKSDEVELENIISKYVKDANDISKEMNAYSTMGYKGFSDLVQANLSRDDEFKSWAQRTNDEEQFKRETGEMPGFEGTLDALDKISIREAFKIEDSYDGYYNQDGKEQYSQFNELDNMNAQEVMAGYVMEKIDNPNIDINEAVKLIIKNLNKDPYYYTNYKLTGVRDEKPVEFTSSKRKPGFDQTEEVSKNGDNLKDTKNAEKVIKEAFKLSGGGAGSGSQTMSWEPEDAYLQKFANLKVGDKVKYEIKRGYSGDVVQIERVGEIVKINPSTIVIGSYKPDGTLSQFPIPKKEIDVIKKLKSQLEVKNDKKLKKSFPLKEGYKPLSNPSKVKLKELVRKMMKEMFDGRDNMTDVTGENN